MVSELVVSLSSIYMLIIHIHVFMEGLEGLVTTSNVNAIIIICNKQFGTCFDHTTKDTENIGFGANECLDIHTG